MPSARAGKRLEKISWKAKKATLTFDDDEKIFLSENAFSEFRLYVGKEIPSLELRKIKDLAALDDLYNYALKLLSARNYTSYEIRTKLAVKCDEVESVRKVIFRLKKNGLLDDEGYARMYLEDAYDVKLIGEKKIRFELDKRGISPEIMANLPFSYEKEVKAAKRFAGILEKRYVCVPNGAKRQKIMNSLLLRGFSHSVANEATLEIKNNEAQDEVLLLEKEYNKAKARYARKYQGYELRQKLTAYLLGKGYRYEDIRNMEDNGYEDDC